jgi:hypothetical protein
MSEEWKRAKMLLSGKCNNRQSCFENGSEWGHFEGIMCKYLGEKRDHLSDESYGFCLRYNMKIEVSD